MSILSSSSAATKVTQYKNRINKFKRSARNNFEDMDFENNKAREDMEKIVEDIERKCNSAIGTLESLSFE